MEKKPDYEVSSTKEKGSEPKQKKRLSKTEKIILAVAIPIIIASVTAFIVFFYAIIDLTRG